MIFLDTETVGLHGMPVLIQYAEDDGPIVLYCPWSEPIWKTRSLIKKFVEHPGGLVAFNISFDFFHLCKLETTLALIPDQDALPEDIIDDIAEYEEQARDGKCLKPVTALDLMLHARKGPYQSTMDRGDIRIRRVPTAIAWQLAAELERRIPLKDIYFARRKDKNAPKWKIMDIQNNDGDIIPDFKDIVLKFAPSSALKVLAVDALNLPQDDVLRFSDIGVGDKWLPVELGYAPFAKAIGSRGNWNGAWPEVIRHHIAHWKYHERAREYAANDIVYLRDLYKYFGSPPLGDDDSILACMVAAVRWRGFKIDVPRLRELKLKALNKIHDIPTAPEPVRRYIYEMLSSTEQLILRTSTKKVLLEEIAKFMIPCPICNKDAGYDFVPVEIDPDKVLNEGANEVSLATIVTKSEASKSCPHCSGKGETSHPAASRAQEVLDARSATKEIENYDKLLLAGRFHASFKVIGALSSRMSGADDLNAQGIKKTKETRECFPLAFGNMKLCGGDFAGFEVTIAEAVYKDDNLRTQLLTCEDCGGKAVWNLKKNEFICSTCGSRKQKKIHALFGVHCFPEHDYNSLKATSGTSDDKYTRAKSGVFALMYGGTEHTLADRLGVPTEVGIKALASFHREFPGVRRFQQSIFDDFCSMRQVGGIGTKVEWHDPADYRETMFGFRRYFTLENRICRALFDLANKPPKAWQNIQVKVNRRDRIQSASGATQSALYGAAFQIQAANMRAATNHDIQSAGATITKHVQRRIWDLQPSGIADWSVQPMNIHDEIMCPSQPEVCEQVRQRVRESVEEFRDKVPLIKMDWVIGLQNWSEKG